MFVSYKWLQDYVDVGNVSPEELAEKITRSGIEVEGVEVKSEGIKNVVVGHVVSCEQHPNADKLNRCLVDIGEEAPIQIICGAPNVAAGQKVAVAKVGAVLPGNFKIKRSKLRGEESNGMICSLQELGIESKVVAKAFSEGIFVFPEDATPGEDALALLGLTDAVLELGLTPNRSDCLSMLGVAYEVAAILGTMVKLPEVHTVEVATPVSDFLSVEVDAIEENPLFVAKMVRNIKIGPSPLWMQTRLMHAGIRPHNNVVDITNYILLEYGQPLHAYDYDRLDSKKIVVRKGQQGEKLTTLDEVERTIAEDQLVITNGEKAIGLAGVMGGFDTEVKDQTTTVVIEAAYFKGATIRQASKAHGLRSEASARFEKGVDPKRVRLAAERAAQLLALYANGEVLTGSVEVDEMKVEEAVVTITLDRINRVLGTSITKDAVVSILERLQFTVEVKENTFIVTVPTRRGDITIEEDIVEEVARLFGYDNLPNTLPTGETTVGGLTRPQQRKREAKRFLEGAGLFQALTYSLTSEEKMNQFTLQQSEAIRLAMPMSEERSHLRLSIVPHLLEVVSYNNARKNDAVALYEIGSVFLSKGENVQPEEEAHIAGALTGIFESHAWQGEKKAVDFFVAKGILDGLFSKLGIPADKLSYRAATIDHMHPGRTAEIFLDGEVIGFVGQVHPTLQKKLDLKETYVFELLAAPVFNYEVPALHYRMIPRFPAITRDIALVLDSNIAAGAAEAVIRENGGKLLNEVHVFDLYEGEHMEQGKKSVAFSLVYLDPTRTLLDEEVVAVHTKVLEAVKAQLGAELRG